MLKTVIKNGTGRGADIGVPCAGKTGTTDDYKDASFVGYTPTVVTGVWVGNDDNTTTKSIQGGSVPARIWRDVMKTAIEQFGKADFNYPEIELKPSWVLKQEDKETEQKEDENTETTDTETPQDSISIPMATPANNPTTAAPAPSQSAPVKLPQAKPAPSPKTTATPSAPKHTPAAAPTPVAAPIPMATPEGN